METPETRYAKTVDGVHIAYRVVGAGPIDLIWAPGTVSHVELYWEEPGLVRFIRRLAAFSRLMVFDKRGTGMSDHATEAATLEERMDDIRAVMDACDSERAVLLGVSEGAPMCALFAATYPERTVGVILCGGYAKGLPAEDYPGPRPGRNSSPTSHEKKNLGACGPTRPPRLRAEHGRGSALLRLASEVVPDGGEPWRRAGAGVDEYGRGHQQCPSRDPRSGARPASNRGSHLQGGGGRYVADRITGAKYVELSGEDHIPWVGDSDSIVREIEMFATQSWREVEPDRVLATVMFTDIVGSTAKTAELGDRGWRDLLGEHHARIRSQLSRFRGVEMDTAGDGFFSVFDGPARAINCAKSIHRALAELGLEARIGIHCGECERMDGKVGGLAVVVGARIASMAGPGECWCHKR